MRLKDVLGKWAFVNDLLSKCQLNPYKFHYIFYFSQLCVCMNNYSCAWIEIQLSDRLFNLSLLTMILRPVQSLLRSFVIYTMISCSSCEHKMIYFHINALSSYIYSLTRSPWAVINCVMCSKSLTWELSGNRGYEPV